MRKPLKKYYILHNKVKVVLEASSRPKAVLEFNYYGYTATYSDIRELVGEVTADMKVVKQRK